MGDDNKIKDVLDAATGLVKAVPIYDDALQPAAKETGKALETVVRAVNVALLPLKMVIWKGEQLEDFLNDKVARRLEGVLPENIQNCNPHVIGPALEALRFTEGQEGLQELYANLLANSLDIETCKTAHPAFVDIIKNMSPDEAKIMGVFASGEPRRMVNITARGEDFILGQVISPMLQTFRKYENVSLVGVEANCEHVELTSVYLDNLSRLGLLSIENKYGKKRGLKLLGDDDIYALLMEIEERKDSGEWTVSQSFSCATTTDFGDQFCEACVIDKRQKLGKGQ